MKPLEQLDLGDMVDVVQRDSHEKVRVAVIPLAPLRPLVETGRIEVSDPGHQPGVGLPQQCPVLLP